MNTVGQYRNRLDNTEDRLQRVKYHIFSTYRVCTLGAHVDHQHGLVTGFAIDKGVNLGLDVSEGSKVVLDSETFSGHVEFDIVSPALVKQGNWGDYAWGAMFALQKRFKLQRGITSVVKGSIPVGGLSSSAGRFDIGSLDTYYEAVEKYGKWVRGGRIWSGGSMGHMAVAFC